MSVCRPALPDLQIHRRTLSRDGPEHPPRENWIPNVVDQLLLVILTSLDRGPSRMGRSRGAVLSALAFVFCIVSYVPQTQAAYRKDLQFTGDSFYSYARQVERDHAEQQFMDWAKICRSRYKSYQAELVQSQGSTNQTWREEVDGAAGSGHPRIIVVDQDGNGDFQTVQAAIDSVGLLNKDRVIIRVNPGHYREKVSISKHKPYITIRGGGMDNTFVEWNDTKNSSYNQTFHSASFAVDSHHFIAQNISFVNNAPIAAQGSSGEQAVALRISGDKAAFYNCGFYGGQDTLYDHKGSHYFQNCYIEGTVDYIFGDGLSLYRNCTLNSIGPGAITAQKRANESNYSGFSIVDSTITGVGPSFLGRAWGNYSRVVFANTLIDVPIAEGGWNNWDDPSRDWRVFYGQYACSGPGANLTNRVPWSRNLSHEEAQPFLSLSFIDGQHWLPQSLTWRDDDLV